MHKTTRMECVCSPPPTLIVIFFLHSRSHLLFKYAPSLQFTNKSCISKQLCVCTEHPTHALMAAATRLFTACILLFGSAPPARAVWFNVLTDSPPYLRRAGNTHAIVDWDTGDLARQVSLSAGVVINHQGVRMLPNGHHVHVDTQYSRYTTPCLEVHGALCKLPYFNSSVLPSAGMVWVTHTLRGPVPLQAPVPAAASRLNELRLHGCPGTGQGLGRTIVDGIQYDISACDIHAMRWTLFLYRDTLTILSSAYPPWLYFLLCLSTVFTLSCALYILRPFKDEAANASLNVTTMHWGLLNCFTSITTIVVMHTRHHVFITTEDWLGFLFATFTFYFYLAVAVTAYICTRRGATTCDDAQHATILHVDLDMQGPQDMLRIILHHVRTCLLGTWKHPNGEPSYEAGLLTDTFILCIVSTCVGIYSSLDHPFNTVTLGALVFRMWNKLIRLGYGYGFAPSMPLVVARLLLDVINISFAVCCAWTSTHENSLTAGIWFTPLLVSMYAIAKYIFLSNTHIS